MTDEELNKRLDNLQAKLEFLQKNRVTADSKVLWRLLGDIEHEAVAAMYRRNTMRFNPWPGRG